MCRFRTVPRLGESMICEMRDAGILASGCFAIQ